MPKDRAKAKALEKYEHYIFLTIGIVLAALLRFSLREFVSGDFRNFLEPWYDFIAQHGGFQALKYDFSNYTPPYLYLTQVATYVSKPGSKKYGVGIREKNILLLTPYFLLPPYLAGNDRFFWLSVSKVATWVIY